MVLPPQRRRNPGLNAVLDELPVKIGRRSVLLFKEKEAKTENEVSIPPNVPMGSLNRGPGDKLDRGLRKLGP